MHNSIPLGDSDLPYASDVATNIINNPVPDYEYAEWDSVTESDEAELLKNIIGTIAAFKPSKALTRCENNSELLSEVKELIEKTIAVWAVNEGYQ